MRASAAGPNREVGGHILTVLIHSFSKGQKCDPSVLIQPKPTSGIPDAESDLKRPLDVILDHTVAPRHEPPLAEGFGERDAALAKVREPPLLHNIVIVRGRGHGCGSHGDEDFTP